MVAARSRYESEVAQVIIVNINKILWCLELEPMRIEGQPFMCCIKYVDMLFCILQNEDKIATF